MLDRGGIFMSNRDQFKLNTLNEFINRKIRRSEAALMLETTERNVSKMARRVEKNGVLGVLHGNKGKAAANKISEDLRSRVIKTVKEKYFDFNVSHCKEMLEKNEQIKLTYSVLYKWLKCANLIKRKKRYRSRIYKQRTRMPAEGILLQMDGSHHKWNGKDEWVLIAAIDDATSKIAHAEFYTSEDTLNCMNLIEKIILKFGIPQSIYVDRAGWFGGTKRDGFCHFVNACETLGIKIIFANSPQAKGRIERAWDTFQDRLIPEMRLLGISNIVKANSYLQNEFINHYWQNKNTVEARLPEVKYRPLQCDIDLKEVLCLKETRQVKKDHTISWDAETYKVSSVLNISIADRQVEIRTYQNLKIKMFYADQEVLFEKITHKLPVPSLRCNEVTGFTKEQVKVLKTPSINDKNRLSYQLAELKKAS